MKFNLLDELRKRNVPFQTIQTYIPDLKNGSEMEVKMLRLKEIFWIAKRCNCLPIVGWTDRKGEIDGSQWPKMAATSGKSLARIIGIELGKLSGKYGASPFKDGRKVSIRRAVIDKLIDGNVSISLSTAEKLFEKANCDFELSFSESYHFYSPGQTPLQNQMRTLLSIHNLNQKELAEKLGIAHTSVKRMFCDPSTKSYSRPTTEMLQKLSKMFRYTFTISPED